MHNEVTGSGDFSSAALIKSADFNEKIGMEGHYVAKCYDKDGNLKWEDIIENQVVQVGKILMLDTLISGSAYTVTGPYMGLLNGTLTFSPTDTMGTKAWTECGGGTAPAYTGNRPVPTFSSATGNNNTTPGSNVATKSTVGASPAFVAFTFTSGGTVAGCFIVLGSGALSTKDNTAGTLYSAGAFTGGSKTVASTDVLNVTYSTTATS
jgi:hypothetical protein